MKKVILGDRVKCQYTGMQGTATQRVIYLGRKEDQIGVQPDSSSDSGSLPSVEYVQENWLTIVPGVPNTGLNLPPE